MSLPPDADAALRDYWNSDEVPNDWSGVRMVAEMAVDLLANRGGTMTAEAYRTIHAFVEVGHTLSPEQASALLAAYDARGAKVAALEASLAAVSKDRDGIAEARDAAQAELARFR
jgi:hypothetical protein